MARPLSFNDKKYTKELLTRLYINQNLSRGEVCKRLDIDEPMLRNILRHYGLVKSLEKQRECQLEGIKEKAKHNWYRENSIKTWQDPIIREKRLKAQADSRTDEWKKHVAQSREGLKQPESQKKKMRELWENGRFDFFRSESYWLDRREQYSERTKRQFAAMTMEQKAKRNAHLSSVFASKSCQEKRMQTMKKNNSFSKSQMEDWFYDLAREKSLGISRQYRSELYPYNCDFYIPELELYIELNLHWTHGGKPYQGTKADRQKVDFWKSKNTKYYDNAVYVWTKLDVEKRNLAKRNNLNFVELYSWDECTQFLNSL